MKNRQEVPTYIKRLFSDVEVNADNVTVINAEDMTSDDLDAVVDNATTEVFSATGDEEFASRFEDNFRQRLFSATSDAEIAGGGEVDIDKAAEDAVEDTQADMDDKEVEAVKAQSRYEDDSRYFSDDLEDQEDLEDITDEDDGEAQTVAQSYYNAGYMDAMESNRMFSLEDSEYEGDVVEGEDLSEMSSDERTVAQSELACTFADIFTRVFAEAKEEGASDTEATAEAAETASIATGVAEEDDSDIEGEVATKVQSLVEENRYFAAFIRTFADAKDAGASDQEATIAAAQDAMEEAGVDSEVAEDFLEEKTSKQSMPEFSGEEFDDEDKSLQDIDGKEALEDVHEFEDAATKLESNVEDLMGDNASFRMQSDLGVDQGPSLEDGINDLI